MSINDDNKSAGSDGFSREGKAQFFTRIWNSTSHLMCLGKMFYDADGAPVDYIILDVNPAFEKARGLARDQAVNKRILELLPDCDPKWIEKCGEAVSSGKTRISVEYDSELDRWYEVQIFPLDSGEQLITIAWDITERKALEADLQAARDKAEQESRKFQTILETSASAVVVVEASGRLSYVNRRGIELYGIDYTGYDIKHHRTELQARKFDGTPYPSEEMPLSHSMLSGKTVRDCEMIIQRSDGLQIPVLVSSSPILDEHGQITSAVVSFDNAAERLEADERIRIENALTKCINRILHEGLFCQTEEELGMTCLNAALELTGSPIGFIGEINPNGNMDDIAVSQTGWYASGMKGSGRSILPKDLPVHGLYGRVLKDGCAFFTNDPGRHPDNIDLPEGHPTMASFIGVPLFENGQIIGLISLGNKQFGYSDSDLRILEKLTPSIVQVLMRKRAEKEREQLLSQVVEERERALDLVEKLSQADQNKNAFINMLSHELRNPLASIMMSLDLLDAVPDKVPSDEKMALMALGIAKRQGKQLTRLVDDLLDVTRITQNKVALKKEKAELNEIIKKAILDYQLQFSENIVRLEVKLTAPIYLEADPSRLTQVIGNLLHNAAKFTSSQDLVTVTVSQDTQTSEAVITVQDTGRGIAPECLKNMFEPFVQADKTLDRSNGGLGLGLAIVKGMVELHGGNVEAFSEGIDKGAKFIIRLPLPKGNIGEPERSEELDLISNESLSILMIEDNKDLARVMCELIAFIGHKAEAAHNGIEGIAKARELRPDVVICDIGLPGMSGYEVAQMICKDTEFKDTFLIALSGYAQPEDVKRSKEAGFDRHLGKPVSFETLQQVLSAVKGG